MMSCWIDGLTRRTRCRVASQERGNLSFDKATGVGSPVLGPKIEVEKEHSNK